VSCPTANELATLVDGGLRARDRERVERHLDHCAACTETLSELAWVVAPETARTWCAERAPDAIVAWWGDAIEVVAALHRRGEVHGALSPDAFVIAATGIELARPAVALAAGYTPVEVLHGAPPSAKSDQFAICACIWEALVGARPFRGATAGALAVTMTVPLAFPATGPRAVLATLRRGLDRDPAKRWRDLDALRARLRRPRAGLLRRLWPRC
jgi:Putative zinc-finger